MMPFSIANPLKESCQARFTAYLQIFKVFRA